MQGKPVAMDKFHSKTLIVIVGPTAVGKTAVAIELAQHYNTAILSADSRQFYREMFIGTAKPTSDELTAAKHYFIDSHSVDDLFTVAAFEKQGLALLSELFKDKDVVILAGGSGLYVNAICDGFDDIPNALPGIREKLNDELAEKGLTYLQEKLRLADPDYYAQVDLNNPQRVIRALEVFESSGVPFSSYRKSNKTARPFNIIKIGLDLPRPLLYQRINKRVDVMVEQGLVDEVKDLLPYRHLNALNTVGYNEIFEYLDGSITLETAIDRVKQNTRRFAKRQLTWFRRDAATQWFTADESLATNIKAFLLDKF